MNFELVYNLFVLLLMFITLNDNAANPFHSANSSKKVCEKNVVETKMNDKTSKAHQICMFPSTV